MSQLRRVSVGVAMVGLLLAAGGCPREPLTPAEAKVERMKTADRDVMQLAQETESLSMFVSAVQVAGLVDLLAEPGPFTVFAPTNDAFRSLPPGRLEDLLQKLENREQLRALLLYHVHRGSAVLASDVSGGGVLASADDGRPLQLTSTDAGIRVNGVSVMKADNVCTNGVVYWVDKVLVPPAGR